MKPLVSIIIPTYNRARDLDRALNSVQAQTNSSWEALVVDNHSSDNTDEVVKGRNDERIKLFKIHNNGVIAASRNLGLQHAQGEYLALLDSDDWWMPEKLAESLKYLDQGADIVYHDMYVVTKAGQKLFWRKDRAREVSDPVFDDLIKHGNALKTSSVVTRTSIFQEIGGQSEEVALTTAEDYDSWLRTARITEKFRRIPKTLGYYWLGSGNTTNPERTIRCLDALEDRYAREINNLNGSAGLSWIEYSKARAYYRLDSYAMATQHLNRVRWGQVPPLSSLKVLWMMGMIKFRHGG